MGRDSLVDRRRGGPWGSRWAGGSPPGWVMRVAVADGASTGGSDRESAPRVTPVRRPVRLDACELAAVARRDRACARDQAAGGANERWGVTTQGDSVACGGRAPCLARLGRRAAVSADAAHPFAGVWITFSGKGRLGLELVGASKGEKAVAFYRALSGPPATCKPSVAYYTGYYQVSGDSGQIAGCTTDATGRELRAWYKSGAGEQHGTVDITVNSDDTSFKGTYRELSNHSGGPYSGTLIPATGMVAGYPVGLLDTEVLRAAPASASNYKFEIKRSSDATWTLLASRASATYQFVARIAGHFQVRVIATVNGKAESLGAAKPRGAIPHVGRSCVRRDRHQGDDRGVGGHDRQHECENGRSGAGLLDQARHLHRQLLSHAHDPGHEAGADAAAGTPAGRGPWKAARRHAG